MGTCQGRNSTTESGTSNDIDNHLVKSKYSRIHVKTNDTDNNMYKVYYNFGYDDNLSKSNSDSLNCEI